MSDDLEKEIALYEAERNRAWNSWFEARGHIPPTDESTLIFDGGFRMAWELCRAQPAPQPAEQQPAPDVATQILSLISDECRYWHGRDEALRGGYAILYAKAKELISKQQPAPDVAGLVEALEGLLPFVTSDSVECRGDKCREHWCLSCWDEETVRETVKNIRTAIARADDALAAHRIQEDQP